MFPQQFSQYKQLIARLRLKLEADDPALFGLGPNPGHPYWQHKGLPEEGRCQRETRKGALGEGITAANLSPSHAEVQKQAGHYLLGFLDRNLGRKGYPVAQLGTKMVQSRHADRLPHVERHKEALPW